MRISQEAKWQSDSDSKKSASFKKKGFEHAIEYLVMGIWLLMYFWHRCYHLPEELYAIQAMVKKKSLSIKPPFETTLLHQNNNCTLVRIGFNLFFPPLPIICVFSRTALICEFYSKAPPAPFIFFFGGVVEEWGGVKKQFLLLSCEELFTELLFIFQIFTFVVCWTKLLEKSLKPECLHF